MSSLRGRPFARTLRGGSTASRRVAGKFVVVGIVQYLNNPLVVWSPSNGKLEFTPSLPGFDRVRLFIGRVWK